RRGGAVAEAATAATAERTGRGGALDSLVVRILTNGRAHARGCAAAAAWVLVLRPLPPPRQQRPLPALLLPPLLLPLKPNRTPRFYGEPALAAVVPSWRAVCPPDTPRTLRTAWMAVVRCV